MWINPQTGDVFETLLAVRQAYPRVSFPSAPTDSDLAGVGLAPLLRAQAPAYSLITQRIELGLPALVDDVWQQDWLVIDLPAEQAAANRAAARVARWEDIKVIRDRKTQQGGYKVGSDWFHSDTFSRTQQIGLTIMGAAMPAGLQWKTMGGTFVDMTPTLAQQIFAAAGAQDAALFAHAEALKAQAEAAQDPGLVDITVGWPETFGGV